MMQFVTLLAAIWYWLAKRVNPFVARPIDISGKVFAQLFLPGLSGSVVSTWGYLGMRPDEQAHVRSVLKANAMPGETPLLVFLLTPNSEAGNLWAGFPGALNGPAVDAAVATLRETVAAGIACAGCLYVDDPSGTMPRWWEIEAHAAGWSRLHERIGPYISAYFLSIETNERARGREHIEACIQTMRQSMSGVQEYGTHLQYGGASGVSGYRWTGGDTTPRNAMILGESSWQPQKGDAIGLSGLQREMAVVLPRIERGAVIWQEYNLNAAGRTASAQREYLRTLGLRGVASVRPSEVVV